MEHVKKHQETPKQPFPGFDELALSSRHLLEHTHPFTIRRQLMEMLWYKGKNDEIRLDDLELVDHLCGIAEELWECRDDIAELSGADGVTEPSLHRAADMVRDLMAVNSDRHYLLEKLCEVEKAFEDKKQPEAIRAIVNQALTNMDKEEQPE